MSGARGAQWAQIGQLVNARAVARSHDAPVGVQAATARVGEAVVGDVGVGSACIAVERRTMLLLLIEGSRGQSLVRETVALLFIVEVLVSDRSTCGGAMVQLMDDANEEAESAMVRPSRSASPALRAVDRPRSM